MFATFFIFAFGLYIVFNHCQLHLGNQAFNQGSNFRRRTGSLRFPHARPPPPLQRSKVQRVLPSSNAQRLSQTIARLKQNWQNSTKSSKNIYSNRIQCLKINPKTVMGLGNQMLYTAAILYKAHQHDYSVEILNFHRNGIELSSQSVYNVPQITCTTKDVCNRNSCLDRNLRLHRSVETQILFNRSDSAHRKDWWFDYCECEWRDCKECPGMNDFIKAGNIFQEWSPYLKNRELIQTKTSACFQFRVSDMYEGDLRMGEHVRDVFDARLFSDFHWNSTIFQFIPEERIGWNSMKCQLEKSLFELGTYDPIYIMSNRNFVPILEKWFPEYERRFLHLDDFLIDAETLNDLQLVHLDALVCAQAGHFYKPDSTLGKQVEFMRQLEQTTQFMFD